MRLPRTGPHHAHPGYFCGPCRHIEGGDEAGGLANHTGFMLCTVHNKGETINDTLINVMRSTKKSKRDKYMGLYSLPLLKLAYTILPFSISEFAIKIGYANPLIIAQKIAEVTKALFIPLRIRFCLPAP